MHFNKVAPCIRRDFSHLNALKAVGYLHSLFKVGNTSKMIYSFQCNNSPSKCFLTHFVFFYLFLRSAFLNEKPFSDPSCDSDIRLFRFPRSIHYGHDSNLNVQECQTPSFLPDWQADQVNLRSSASRTGTPLLYRLSKSKSFKH